MSNVVHIIDHIRKRSGTGHEALVRALERPLPVSAIERDQLADWILEGLWIEGYKVAPREQDNAG